MISVSDFGDTVILMGLMPQQYNGMTIWHDYVKISLDKKITW